jgi:hypothetical protein
MTDEFTGIDEQVASNEAIQQAADFDLFYNSAPITTTTESTRLGVANDDSVQTAGQTQNGVSNSQSPDAGRETQDTTLLTGARPGEGA